MAKEETINVTLTLSASQVDWIDERAKAEFEGNRSQAARKILREVMAAEASDDSDK